MSIEEARQFGYPVEGPKRYLGPIAYTAYADAADWKTHDGRSMPMWEALGEHIQLAWAAAGAAVVESRIDSIRAVLADREMELLKLKGPCRTADCRLHYAHSGPCDLKPAAP